MGESYLHIQVSSISIDCFSRPGGSGHTYRSCFRLINHAENILEENWLLGGIFVHVHMSGIFIAYAEAIPNIVACLAYYT